MTRPFREVRVFVSSTFQDMHPERDALTSRAFPLLEQRCAQSAISFVGVDLRWGITEEESVRSGVLKVCFDQIDDCRPYFVGILGARYGWVPPSVPPELVHRARWIPAHGGASITELEIRHAVLESGTEGGRRAFFYFLEGREPAREDRRLRRLKDEIARRFPARPYRSPAELAALVIEDLGRAIDDDFPIDPSEGGIARRALEHRAAGTGAASPYVSIERVDANLEQVAPGRPLVVVGPAESGKSAAIAHWVDRLEAAGRPECVLHMIGATTEPRDGDALRTHVYGELARRQRAKVGMTGRRLDEFLICLGNALDPVIAIDNIDRLTDWEDPHALGWLMRELPARATVVATARPGNAAVLLGAAGWRRVDLPPLSPDEVIALLTGWLAAYGKTLDREALSDVRTSVAHRPWLASPGPIVVLADELRQFGVHERVRGRLAHYLASADTEGLYDRLLARLEETYEGDPAVGELLTTIALSHRGLSESELSRILVAPRMRWAPILSAMKPHLTSVGGLRAVRGAALRSAVERRYLSRRKDAVATRRRLLAHFASLREESIDAEAKRIAQETTEADDPLRMLELYGDAIRRRLTRSALPLLAPPPRKLDEVPYQLRRLGDRRGLRRLMADEAFWQALLTHDPAERRACTNLVLTAGQACSRCQAIVEVDPRWAWAMRALLRLFVAVVLPTIWVWLVVVAVPIAVTAAVQGVAGVNGTIVRCRGCGLVFRPYRRPRGDEDGKKPQY